MLNSNKFQIVGFFLLVFALGFLAPTGASAHALGQSYLFLTIHEDRVTGRFELTVQDTNQALGIDLSTSGDLELKDIETHIDSAWKYITERILLFPDGQKAILALDNLEIASTSQAQYFAVNFSLKDQTGIPDYIDFEYDILFDLDSDHRGFVVVENDWKTGTFQNEAVISLIFDPGTTSGRLDLTSSTVAHGFWEMTKLGVHHIWAGIDHVLFLLALLLPAVLLRGEKGWEPAESFRASLIYVVKIVTLFTVAHTITLSAATLGSLAFSSRLVESVIAISITIAALDLLWPVFRRHIWWVVFAFGLFHGLGFATVLSEIGVPPGYMTFSLLAFNVGVELGQLVIVIVTFPLLYLIRESRIYRYFLLPAAAIGLVVVSMYWFIERGFLIDLPAGEYANWILGKVGLRE